MVAAPTPSQTNYFNPILVEILTCKGSWPADEGGGGGDSSTSNERDTYLIGILDHALVSRVDQVSFYYAIALVSRVDQVSFHCVSALVSRVDHVSFYYVSGLVSRVDQINVYYVNAETN